MNQYKSIQHLIDNAKIQRSVYLSELITDMIVKAKKITITGRGILALTVVSLTVGVGAILYNAFTDSETTMVSVPMLLI